MRAEKSFRLFPITHQYLFLACFFSASQRLAAATHWQVSHRWSKRSNKTIGYELALWPASAT